MEKDYQKIEQYLWGDMTEAEKKAFEQEMSQNPHLRKEVRFYHDLKWAFKNQALLDLNEKLKNIPSDVSDHQTDDERAPSSSSMIKKWGWGASFVILALLVGGLWWLSMNKQASHLRLANQYLEPFESVFNLPSGTQNPLSEGINAYNSGRFEAAIDQLEPFSNTSDVKLYLSVSYLMERQPENAIPLLNDLISQSDPVLQPAARWYLALAFLMQNRVEEAFSLLRQLTENENYASSSRALLKDLQE